MLRNSPGVELIGPRISVSNFKILASKHMFLIKFMGPSCEIALSGDTFDDKSTLVQVMAWSR